MITKIKELTDLLNKARYSYYQLNRSIMSDKEYDRLLDMLAELENKYNFRLSNSPTKEVGAEALSELQKKIHKYRLYSLNKTKTVKNLQDLAGPHQVIVSPKLDGLTICLTYQDGELIQALTRGNGYEGEDVTHNARVFANLPLKIPHKGNLIVSGEAVIKLSDFDLINESLSAEEQYKNPRNLVSGSVRTLDNRKAAKRRIHFYAFALLESEYDFTLKSEQLLWLKEQGFDVVDFKMATADQVPNTVEEFEKKLKKYDIATDGLVITLNDINYAKSLGATAKYPKDSLAFKWADDSVETKLVNIEWQTGRTGKITPIAVFEPVMLEGTIVTRASLHNVSILKELKLGIGDVITVYKANMIIPQVEDNLTQSNTYQIPSYCPQCNGEATIERSNNAEVLVCTNSHCPAKLIQALAHFTSRDAMNIEGLSVATLEKFIEKEFVRSILDIYELEKYRDEIIDLPGFGEKSFENLINSIEKSKDVEPHRLLYALGINHIGITASKALCEAFTIEELLEANYDDILKVEGFGEKMAFSVFSYCRQNRELINRLLKIVRLKNESSHDSTQNILVGKVFVVTGKLNSFKHRKELQRLIESLGGKVASSVTKKTNYLITNYPNSGSNKNKTAAKMGIPVISEQEFMKMFGIEE